MHFPTLIATLTAALASATPLSSAAIFDSSQPLSKRECFGSGETWGDSKQTALDAADYACLSTLGAPTTYNGSMDALVFSLQSQDRVLTSLR